MRLKFKNFDLVVEFDCKVITVLRTHNLKVRNETKLEATKWKS